MFREKISFQLFEAPYSDIKTLKKTKKSFGDYVSPAKGIWTYERKRLFTRRKKKDI